MPVKPRKLAHKPDLLDQVSADVEALGLVGEKENGLLLYLTGTSRLLDDPLRLILQGASGSGKSQIPKIVVPMFPTEEVIHATSLTPNALYYLEPGTLEHKLVVGGERKHSADEETADSTAALRQLISENRITKVVTQNIGGQFVTTTIEQDGPIAYCETTTCNNIFAEDLNRCLLVQTDDSAEQTRRVLKASASKYSAHSAREKNHKAIINRHREFQRSLKRCKVVIPYAERLADKLPAGRVEARRVIKQVFGTIEAIVLLHQHQRDRDPDGRLLATKTDYETARRLLLPSLSESIGCSDKAKSAHDKLRKKFPKDFDSNEALKAGGFTNKMTRDRMLKELAELGVLKLVAKGKSHRPAQWRWTDQDLNDLVLPRFVTA